MQLSEILLERPWFGPEAKGAKNIQRIAKALSQNWLAWKGSMGVSATAPELADFIKHQYANMADTMAPELERLGNGPDPAIQQQTDKTAQIDTMNTNNPPVNRTGGPPIAMPDNTPEQTQQIDQQKLSPELQTTLTQLPQMVRSAQPDGTAILQLLAKASNQAQTPADKQNLKAMITRLTGNATIMQKIPALAALTESLQEAAMLSNQQLNGFFVQMAQSMMRQQKLGDLSNTAAPAPQTQRQAPQQASSIAQPQQTQTQNSSGSSIQTALRTPINANFIRNALRGQPPAEVQALIQTAGNGRDLSDVLRHITTPTISGKTLGVLLAAMAQL